MLFLYKHVLCKKYTSGKSYFNQKTTIRKNRRIRTRETGGTARSVFWAKPLMIADAHTLYRAVQFVAASDRRLFGIRSALIAVQSILPLLSLYLLKLLVDSITEPAAVQTSGTVFSQAGIYALLFSGIFFLTRISNIFINYTDEILTQKLIDYISGLLHKKSVELDLAFYDNAKYHDTFHRAQQEANFRPVQVLNNLTGILKNSLTLVGIVIILITLSFWFVAIMLLAALPVLLVKLRRSKKLYAWRKTNTPLFRKANYFGELLTGREYAKEVRVFTLEDHFQKQFTLIRKGLVREIVKLLNSLLKLDLFSSGFEVAALLAGIILLSGQTASGAITTGSFVMFFEAFRRSQGLMQGLVADLSGLYSNKLFLNNLFEFLELKPNIQEADKPVPFPQRIKEGIRFDNVSFTYPGSEKPVLENLSLQAKPGEVALIRGVNGAGKTTLIKLLCRLYDCTEGAIYIDGMNIKEFDLRKLRKNIAVLFQDFARYDFTAAENIALEDLDNRSRSERIQEAARLSSADTVIAKLPKGYDTLLGKYFEKGEELSMGQWQRVALARTLYADARIMVLDEPTSWMDAEAEAHFYQQLEQVKKGKIVLLVDHHSDMSECASSTRCIRLH